MSARAEDALLPRLVDELRQAAVADVTAVTSAGYLALAEDYDTVVLMGEVPEHAEQAVAAWHTLMGDKTAPPANLFRVFAKAYRAAAQ